MGFAIEMLGPEHGARFLPGLTGLTEDAVQAGASVGFLLPLEHAGIKEYWQDTLARLRPGSHALLAGLDEQGQVSGAVQLIRSPKANGVHRAEVAKLLVHRKYRRRGLGRALMEKLETLARGWGVTLLVLDTATPAAEKLYHSMDWVLAGRMPGFAYDPDGSGPHEIVFYYKRL